MIRTKRIRLRRSIILNREHAEAGSVHELAQPLADDLIAQGSAVQVNFVSRFFARIWFFFGSRSKREEADTAQDPLRIFSQEETMDTKEKAVELIERAAKLGLRLEFNSGLNTVKLPAAGDPEKQRDILQELVKYLPEVRALCQRRTVAVLGKTLVSRRIWCKEYGEGTLVGASEDGGLTISIGAEVRKSHEEEVRRLQTSISFNAKDLLVLLDE